MCGQSSLVPHCLLVKLTLTVGSTLLSNGICYVAEFAVTTQLIDLLYLEGTFDIWIFAF